MKLRLIGNDLLKFSGSFGLLTELQIGLSAQVLLVDAGGEAIFIS